MDAVEVRGQVTEQIVDRMVGLLERLDNRASAPARTDFPR
jgi:hypothetical protein